MSTHLHSENRQKNRDWKKIGKISGIAFSFFVLLILSINLWMSSRVPIEKGTLTLPGLSAEVEVHRDEFGVPHIFAKNEDDLFLALGYIQASERWFQMEIMRRVIGGRLSELLGPELIKADRLFRTLGFKRNSEKWLEKYDKTVLPAANRGVDQYLKGLNTFVNNGPTPEEFAILGIKREAFTKSDVYGMVAYMGFSFAEALSVDPTITSLEKEFGSAKIRELTTENTSSAPYIVDDSKKLAYIMGETIEDVRTKLADSGIALFQGSNSWAVSRGRSKSGAALIANDPHIAFSNPSIWFEAYVNAPGIDLYGHFLPMIPFAVIGFNKDLAWSLTMFENDDMDFYQETLNPKNKDQVMFQGKPEDIKKTEEVIQVKGQDPVTITIRESRHGSFMDGVNDALINEKSPIALKWGMFIAGNKPQEASYLMNHAKNISEFEKALNNFKAPGINMVYADKQGNIAYWGVAGLNEKTFIGDRILDGSSGKYEWGPEIPFSNNPKSINPPSGIIITANNRSAASLPPKLFGYYQADDRANRLNTILRQKKKWSLEEMKEVILDDYFESTDYILNPFFSLIRESESKLTDKEKEVLKALERWDRFGNKNEAGAAIFSELKYFLAREMFFDEMGEERFNFIAGTNRVHHFFKANFLNPKSSWWDNVKTKEFERPKDVMYSALVATTSSLMGKLGTNPSHWKWGNLHKLEFVHPIGRVKPLNLIFNAGPFPVSGGDEVVNNIKGKFSKNDHVIVSGPSMRRLIDFADPDGIQIINPLGMSGHRKSRHFQDQALMYASGKFRQISLNQMKNQEMDNKLILKPGN
ncbi:MAG: penicillin acylase family protein [Leptospira sp.]|nr:penicillin acylase family protein [Leptospira sp.]